MNIIELGAGIVALSAAVTLYRCRHDKLVDLIGTPIMIGLVSTLACVCAGGAFSSLTATTEVEDRGFQLKSAFSTQEYHGSFILGTGSVDAIDNYVFYMETVSGWSRHKEPVAGVYIKEVPGTRPTAIFRVVKVVDNALTRFTMQSGKIVSFTLANLIVPTGTIYQKFELK